MKVSGNSKSSENFTKTNPLFVTFLIRASGRFSESSSSCLLMLFLDHLNSMFLKSEAFNFLFVILIFTPESTASSMVPLIASGYLLS